VNPTPPRPNGVGRPGSGKHHDPAPERSISPVPATQRPEELASKIPGLPTKIVEAQFEPQVSDPRREPIQLPSPRRAREQTRHDWPPQSVPAPGYRPKQESAPEFHFHLEQHQGRPPRDDSMPPKSARERAGDAIRSPVVKVLGILLGAFGAGGGGNLIVDELKPDPVEKPATSQEIGSKLVQNQRNFSSDLEKNDKADRAREDWTEDELKKLVKRVRRCEAKQKIQADEELQPDAPPEAPPPPRKPDLPEKL
jgi:hypothetical protein